MPVRHDHVLLTMLFFAVLVSCRDQGNRPDADSSPILPTDKATGLQEQASPGDMASLSAKEEEPMHGEFNSADSRMMTHGKVPSTPMEHPPTARFSPKSAVYDRQGSAFDLLQSPRGAMKQFPADSAGNIDWVSTLAKGLIEPRASLMGKGAMKRRFDEIVMKATKDMPWVNFPHAQHTEWLDCSNCHPVPFSERKGSNQISMESIMRGQHCGTCHDRVAFSIFSCERCHSIPHAGSPAKWW